LLAHGRWFSLGTPASSTTNTGHHDIAEILLKVVQKINQNRFVDIGGIFDHYCLNLLFIINYSLNGENEAALYRQ
jgi:hypothetical protein